MPPNNSNDNSPFPPPTEPAAAPAEPTAPAPAPDAPLKVDPTPAEQPPAGPAPSAGQQPQQTQGDMEKVGEHPLTNGELALFAEIYQSFEKLRLLTAMFLCEKHGYPESEPVAFEFNWQNRTVAAYRPKDAPAKSSIEVTGDAPSAPTPRQTP